MKLFFLLLEIFIPLFAVYIVYKKKDLAVVYIPFLLFCSNVLVKSFSASLNYLVFTGMIGYLAYTNMKFIRRNVFSILLFIYFLFLIPKSDDIVSVRPYIFASLWLFLLIPISVEIYKKYSREEIFAELSKSAFLILLVFNINVILSTLFKFMPLGTGFYGATSGLMYGALSLDHLNILPFTLFIVVRKGIKDKSPIYILIYLIAIFFAILTFRRTVMALSIIGTLIVMIELLDFKQIKDFILYGAIIGLVSVFVVYKTGFLEQFWERYNMRKLDTRGAEKEPRLLEFEMIYKDMFVHFDYSPWFGYKLFESTGNYGKGRLGIRALHTDFGTMMHSGGIIGFSLYLLMIFVAFFSVWRKSNSKNDILQFLFVSFAFAAFFMSGRWYTISATSMMYCLLFLPLGRKLLQIRNEKLVK
jgi:hypothetical protein